MTYPTTPKSINSSETTRDKTDREKEAERGTCTVVATTQGDRNSAEIIIIIIVIVQDCGEVDQRAAVVSRRTGSHSGVSSVSLLDLDSWTL